MIQRRLVFNCIKVIPVLLILGLLYSCSNEEKTGQTVVQETKAPISKGKNVALIYSEQATVKIKILAPLMEEYDAESGDFIEMNEGVKILFYDSLLNVTSTLTSKYAIHRVGKKIMEAKKDVVVVNEQGEQLNTEHLIWYQDSAKIYSDVQVKITTEDEVITGTGMEANQDFSKWKIHKIKGIINVQEDVNPS